jgi:tetratricopeptide (TPR) repeat protein
MVSCTQCNTHNSLDSAFCKKCGATLDADAISLATEKLAATIADGNRLFGTGRTDDALMVAETAIASNPRSAAAISLKGMCLERKGLLAEALECFERVVDIEPDSTLDKLKVNDLKNLLVVEKLQVKQGPDRKVALVGAFAAVVLVISGGAMFAKANAKEAPDASKLLAMNEPANEVRTFGDVMPKDLGGQNPNSTQSQQQPQIQQPAQENSLDGTAPVQNQPRERERISLPRYANGPLPSPESGIQGPIGPVKVEIPEGGLPNVGGGSTRQAITRDPDPTPTTNTTPPQPPANDPPKNDPGIIEIEVSKGGNKVGGSGEVAPTGNGRTALIATARSQMMSGNYGGAASTYERALRAGADPASTNQRLGQCYAQMGRNGDAVAAYTRAAAAFEKAGNAQGAEACRQAVKVLGG